MIKGVIFDRDGTLIDHVPYLSKVSDVVVIEGVFEALQRLVASNIQVFIATNQSGIGRGFLPSRNIMPWRIILNVCSTPMGFPFNARIIAQPIHTMALVCINVNRMIENPIRDDSACDE